ncbi:MAG: glutaredoxin family protein [Gammaproteobacteria bacterium]
MSRPLTLYYRDGCHLCGQMLAELRALYGEDCPVVLVDVDGDAGLRARYGLRVPVLMGGERMLGSGRLDPTGLEEYLAGK